MRRHSSRALLGLTSIALLIGSTVLAAPAGAATPEASKSANWLVDQLSSGLVESEFFDGSQYVGYTDHGLTLDVFYALTALDLKPAKRAGILGAIDSVSADYTDPGGDTYAGAVGKLLTAVLTAGLDPATYGAENLVTKLEGLIGTTGDEAGRAKDISAFGDSSNTFGQSYVATGLSAAGSDLADEAVAFFLAQQCSDGFFREGMDSSNFTCDSGTPDESSPSLDATATAALAALVLATTGPVDLRDEAQASADAAVDWLASRQVKNGTFKGSRNSNSTGLAAVALDIAGKSGRARRAAEWVDGLRVTKKLVEDTAFRARDLGAIAFDRAAFKAGKADAITRDQRHEWRRATAQGAPALDLLG